MTAKNISGLMNFIIRRGLGLTPKEKPEVLEPAIKVFNKLIRQSLSKTQGKKP